MRHAHIGKSNGQEGNMTDNNNTTPNFDDFSRSELVDLIVSANNQVTDLTDTVDNLRQGIVDRDLKAVELKDCIRAVVDKFRSELVDDGSVTIGEWDDLREWFDDFDGIADLEPPTRTLEWEITLVTTVSGTAVVTDSSLDESDIEDAFISGLDLSQRLRVVPTQLDGFDDIDSSDNGYQSEFEVDRSSFDVSNN